MKTIILAGVLAATISTCLAAAPSYGDAEKWRREFVQARDGTGLALTKDASQQAAYTQRLAGLAKRSESLFGRVEDHVGDEGLIECSRAVDYHRSAWQMTRVSLTRQDATNAGGQMMIAFKAGESYANCSRAIESLEQLSAKR